MARASSEAAGEHALEDVFDERAGDEGVEPFLSERGEAVAGADDGAGDRGDPCRLSAPEAAATPIAVTGSCAQHIEIA